MEQMIVSERNTRLEELASNSSANGYGLNLVLLYEDAETRGWAREAFERAATVAGSENIRATWWKLADLSTPGVLAGAISTALRADVLVVATRAAEELAMPFYLWAETWAAHRVSTTGALVALLGTSTLPAKEQARLREYLRRAAKQGRMDFVLEERELPGSFSSKLQASPRRQQDQEATGQAEFTPVAFAS